MKYTTYLFDFDGTLVDSMPSYVGVMLRILDEEGVQYESDVIKTVTPLGFLGTAKYYIEHFGIKKSPEELIKRMNSYAYEEYAHRIAAKKNVIETLTELKSRGADLNVLTASPHLTLDVCLKRLGIFDIFTNVWSCDDFGTTKADTKIYERASERLGKPIGEILFLDDNLNADLTAKRAGMRVAGVYDESSRDYTEEIKAATDHYISDFAEILNL